LVSPQCTASCRFRYNAENLLLIRLGLATCPLNPDQSARTHRLTRSQPASGLWRQPELCQQSAEVTAQDGVRGGAFQNGCQARSIRFHTVSRTRRVPRVREVSLQGVRYDVTQAVIPAVPVGGRTTCQCLRIPSHNGPVIATHRLFRQAGHLDRAGSKHSTDR